MDNYRWLLPSRSGFDSPGTHVVSSRSYSQAEVTLLERVARFSLSSSRVRFPSSVPGGCSSMVEYLASNQRTRVRIPSSVPSRISSVEERLFYTENVGSSILSFGTLEEDFLENLGYEFDQLEDSLLHERLQASFICYCC